MNTEHAPQNNSSRKTPDEASEFEREQLRFLLSGDDVASTLAQLNPSLAWLPVLQQMQVIHGDNQLIAWIEKNFTDAQAIRDVAANLRFFGPDAATLLEYRLNKANAVPTLLHDCWRLIIRYLKDNKQGLLRSEWFEIAPQISRGEHSAMLLERMADALRPKLKLGQRSSLYESEQPERPSDLMSIEYEVDDGLSPNEVLQAWPISASPSVDARAITKLTISLDSALADATDVGVESNEGYSISDSDVPSVADHQQNEYRDGFFTIVRVTAELWVRLAQKEPQLALPFVESWRTSNFRLLRRLALFACTDQIVSQDFAADALIELPRRELFLTNSTVEVYRLIRIRWNAFPSDKQNVILQRFCAGPERDWFREGADIDGVIDRCRYDIFAEMERDGLKLTEEATRLLNDIRQRWPEWRLRPPEQAGFHVWHSTGTTWIEGSAEKLENAPDDELVEIAKNLADNADFLDGNDWQALCLADPDRAFRGLSAAAKRDDWSIDFWRHFLWARKEYQSPDTEPFIAVLLLQWPKINFALVAGAASSWLNEHVATLDEALLWPLWDKIATASLTEISEPTDA